MFTLWFMGRPAAGKSTIAHRVETELRRRSCDVVNLDGDDIRKNLYPDLGFSREDRRTNNRRTAYIAKLFNQKGIPVIVGMITPFRNSQNQARVIIESEGEFVLVHVKCSLEEAERRDPKGLYQQAREGKIDSFTGVNHPYQEPHNAEIVVDTEEQTQDEAVENVLNKLEERGILNERSSEKYGFDISEQEERDVRERLVTLGHL